MRLTILYSDEKSMTSMNQDRSYATTAAREYLIPDYLDPIIKDNGLHALNDLLGLFNNNSEIKYYNLYQK